MTRKEHRVKALNSVYENLSFASSYCLSHNELLDLRKQIENLREKVSKMIDKDMEDLYDESKSVLSEEERNSIH